MLKLIKKPHRRKQKGSVDPLIYTVTGGVEYTVEEICKETGLHKDTIKERVKRLGWRHPKIFAKVKPGWGHIAIESDAEAIQKLIANDKVCPIMQGASNLRITKSGWKTACSFHRERLAANNNKYPSNRYCFICEGKDIPKGISWITKKELKTFAEGR